MTCAELRAQIEVLDAVITADQADVAAAVAAFQAAVAAVGAAHTKLSSDQNERNMLQMQLSMKEMMGMC